MNFFTRGMPNPVPSSPAVPLRLVGLLMSKRSGDKSFRHADAVVADPEFDVAVGDGLGGNLDFSTRFGKLDGVGDQGC